MKSMLPAIKAISCCGLVILSSCATTAGDPAVRQARNQFQTRTTYTQGIVGGALIGAGIGALIGANSGRAAEGALIGGAAGAGAGGMYAHHKVQQRRQYAQQEDNLNAAIKNAASTREAARKFNEVLASKIGAARASEESLNGTLADSRAVLNSVDRELATQRQTLQEAKAANLSASDRDRLSSEITGLQTQRDRLQGNINKLSRGSQPL